MDQIPVMEYHKVLFTDLAESNSLPIMLLPRLGINLNMGFLEKVMTRLQMFFKPKSCIMHYGKHRLGN